MRIVPFALVLLAAAPATADLCLTCISQKPTPAEAANDQAHAADYHPNHSEMAWFDPSPVDQTGKDRLLVFLPGSPFQPDQYRNFAKLAAHHGYHVVVLDFWNLSDVRTICGNANSPDCPGAVRRQI